MNLLVIAVILFADIVCGISLKKRDTEEAEGIHTCKFNNQTFKEGDVLPTQNFCLDCKCTKDFVEPNAEQCQVIQCPDTDELARGCTPIYDGSGCCPSWDCENIHLPGGKCDKRYFKHYKAKGCTPVYDEDTDCPVRFQCPEPGSREENKSVCHFEGKEYGISEAIDIGNPCQICSCQRRYSDEVDIVCISIECPSAFGIRPNESCYDVYDQNSCCPTSTHCTGTERDDIPAKVCVHDGKTYQLGQRIYPKEDPCLICTCTEDWTDIHGNSCRRHNCALERKKSELEDGCVPIYHEKTCCPIEFFCGAPHEYVEPRNGPAIADEEIESGNTCVFKGVHYGIGEYLNIQHPTNCVTCRCTTPPDFTCIHRSCPGPPNADYKNCRPHFRPGQCCAQYECKPPPPEEPAVRRSPPKALRCTPVQCPKGCSKVTVSNSCPFCHCAQRLCSAPKCPEGCQVTNNVAPGQCPTCRCPDSIKVDDQCLEKNMTCPSWCTLAFDPFGCPSCICGGLCSPPKCKPGCKVERNVGKGECPRCVCSGDPEGMLHCSPVQCPATCREVMGESGCPSCICEPQCSMPKCDPGCRLQPPSHSYECSKCVCGDQDNIPTLMCAPVKCGPLCREALDGRGCPTCICDPACTVPRCEAGCRLDYDRKAGPCPRCVCDKVCPTVTCGSMCSQVTGDDGCPTCLCGPLCSAPRCEPGCYLEYDGVGACPACVCDQTINNRGVSAIQCSMPACEPGCPIDYSTKPCPTCNCGGTASTIQCSQPACAVGCTIDYSTQPCPSCNCNTVCPTVTCGSMCSQVTGNDGCPTCLCVLCRAPRCEPGCYLNFDVVGACPACVCDQTVNNSGTASTIQCSQPACAVGCTIDYSTQPCPSCNCNTGVNSRIPCGILNCPATCKVDYNTSPCPSCTCTRPFIAEHCTQPNCNAGCRVDYSTQPCPSCSCPPNPITPTLQCTTPVCRPECQIDYDAKPCPACVCSSLECTPLHCSLGCRIDYDAKPCPKCICEDVDLRGLPSIACSQPKCDDAGCTMDYSTKPCPSCRCDGHVRVSLTLQCTTPICRPECRINYDAKPCPACDCSSSLPLLQCAPLKCDDPGCSIDYSTKPCPSCHCSVVPTIQCTIPYCNPSCFVDYSTKPCPSCSCTGTPKIACSVPRCPSLCSLDFSGQCPKCLCNPEIYRAASPVPTIQCSPPKCDEPDCSIDYTTKPCPSCSCKTEGAPILQCSPPKCDDPGCIIDYSAKPCPACYCKGSGQFVDPTAVQCSPVKCDDPGCSIDYSAKPCPACHCIGPGQFIDPTAVQCSPVKCDDPGCSIDYSAKPCPACHCKVSERFSDPIVIQCSPVKCDDPGCSIDYSAKPCPACHCKGTGQFLEPVLQCSPVKCGEGCVEVVGKDGCSTCRCKEPICSTPRCNPGCRIDYNADPCPACICDRNMRAYATQLHVFQNPICRQITCGPRCQRDPAPLKPGQQCPNCICQVKGGRSIKNCASMQCQLPCRWKRYVEHGCPTCICHPLSMDEEEEL